MYSKWVTRWMSVVALSAVVWSAEGLQAHAAYDDMDAVSLSRLMLGTTYTAGGASPSAGFNTSGLNYYVFRMLDYQMPRSLSDQFRMSKPWISTISALKPGDVLFFGHTSTPSFSGIYIGNGRMIVASPTADRVEEQSVSTYKATFLGARRVLSVLDQKRVQLVLTAKKYLGTPYDFGAAYGQTNTFDCSSFMKWIFAQNGIDLPRTSRQQATVGAYVSKSNLETGDLVFFTTPNSGSTIGHVGMYVGNGMMIHTYGDGGVKFSSIENTWWSNHYVTARRVL